MGADFVIALKTAFAQICLTGISDHRLRWLTFYSGLQRRELHALWFSVAPLLEGTIGNNQDRLEFPKFKNLQAIQEPKIGKMNTQLNT